MTDEISLETKLEKMCKELEKEKKVLNVVERLIPAWTIGFHVDYRILCLINTRIKKVKFFDQQELEVYGQVLNGLGRILDQRKDMLQMVDELDQMLDMIIKQYSIS
jgi:hypothetical protein